MRGEERGGISRNVTHLSVSAVSAELIEDVERVKEAHVPGHLLHAS